MAGAPQVLMVGHDASRTGAPGLGLRWLRWAERTGAADTAVWLEQGGPLVPAFAAVSPTRVAGPVHRAVAEADHRGGTWGDRARAAVPPRHPLGDRPVVVANTLAAWSAAAAVRRRGRLVVWVHELDHVAERILGPEQRASLLARTDHLVAEGGRVATMLRERWQVAPDRITVVDSFADPPGAGGSDTAPSDPAPHPDVVAVGSLTPRKGPDAFAAVLAAVRTAHPTLRAAWIGGSTTSEAAQLLRHDLAAAGLTDQVALVGEVDDVDPWLGPGSVLVHTAREDPAPVAVIEAALRGTAVATWDTGGAADLLRLAGVGHLVAPAGDVLDLARIVQGLLDDPGARQAAGAALQEAAAARTTDQLAPLLLAAFTGRWHA